jgi:P27 family predicted phage terminase small subunit
MPNRRHSGRGGPKAAPTSLKIAAGVRSDRIPVGEPKAPSGQPEAPTHFDAYELEGWNSFVADVQALGLLSKVDRHAAAVFATAYGRGRHFDDDIKKRGPMVVGIHGVPTVNPAVGAKERCEKIMISVLSLYGLTPSDRSRLRASEKDDVDPLEKFLREKSS